MSGKKQCTVLCTSENVCEGPSLETDSCTIPYEALDPIIKSLHDDDVLFVAMTCRNLRDAIYLLYNKRHIKETLRVGKPVNLRRWSTKIKVVFISRSRALWAMQRFTDPGSCVLEEYFRFDADVHKKQKPKLFSEILSRRGAKYGFIAIMELAAEIITTNEYFIKTAGNIDFCKSVIKTAAAHGNFNIIEWFQDRNFDFDKSAVDTAAKYGQYETLVWMSEEGDADRLDWYMDTRTAYNAAIGGCSKCFEYVLGQLYNEELLDTINDNVYKAALQGGYAVILGMLTDVCADEQFEDPKEETCHRGARDGFFSVVQWAHNAGLAWDYRTTEEAAGNGHKNILEWAVLHQCAFRPGECRMRAVENEMRAVENSSVIAWLDYIRDNFFNGAESMDVVVMPPRFFTAGYIDIAK
jgi:hypothetical protein